MNKDEKIEIASNLAKEKYGEHWLAGLWGSARVLLSEKDLDIMISVLEKN